MTKKKGSAPLNGTVAFEGTTRQLLTDEAPPLASQHLVFAQASDVGVARQNNQDSALSYFGTLSSADNRPDFGVFIVADGMGGHHDGEKASAVAARTVLDEIIRRVLLPLIHNDDERAPVTEVLEQAILSANDAVMTTVPEGGTTLTALVIVGDFGYVGHVGDSRAYLIQQGISEQLTRDHSFVQRLFELGEIDHNQLENHQQKNVLYKALGQPELQDIDIMTRRLPADTTLLLCSDGLWGQVGDPQIRQILSENPDVQIASAELVAAANRAGGIDNVSAIVIRIPA